MAECPVLAAKSGRNEEAFQGVFLNRLSEQVKDKLATKDKLDSLDILITLAIQLDNHMLECHSESASWPQVSQAPRPPPWLSTNPASELQSST